MLYIQGFWQVMEEKAKFRGIFRNKFAENLANFVGISREFQVKNGWFCGYFQRKFR